MVVSLTQMMDESLEIRKLPESAIRKLAESLEYNESWKLLMQIIPKMLSKTDYKCDITPQNLHKYKSQHFKLIENASASTGRPCTEILLNEWSTSGRIRPALGHLLYLLKKAVLFQAADFVAVELLKQEPPERPKTGPAALVTTECPSSLMSDVNKIHKEEICKKMDKAMNEIEYSSSLYENVEVSIDTNINYETNNSEASTDKQVKELIVPKIIVSEVPSSSINKGFNTPIVMPRKRESSSSNNESSVKIQNKAIGDAVPDISILMKNNDNSSKVIEECESRDVSVVPHISALMRSSVLPSETSDGTEDSSKMLQSSVSDEMESKLSHDEIVPQISSLMKNDSVEAVDSPNSFQLPNLSLFNLNEEKASDEIPALSQLINNCPLDPSAELPKFSGLLESKPSTQNLPLISDLFEKSSDKIHSTSTEKSSDELIFKNLSTNVQNNLISRTNCVSPLPNLSLTTNLKHFTYCELEVATNGFDETPHKNPLEMENSSEDSGGRFLGSGAFGSVYLALGLFDRPVAVKKLYLNNADVVNEDDPVTVQFKREVEVLCKYKHENLLSLLGYSCDGTTYCLMYEYISGGALLDRLQNTRHRLQATERLNIAMGTAKAISYLHTAFELIHRDIKSANILLDCENKPKLCDFGLIKLTTNKSGTASTLIKGTSAYMSPEACRGDVSKKMDTFSFGVVLLELLTGLPPLDQKRQGNDLLTFMEENCDRVEDLPKFLDPNAGTWILNDYDFATSLFIIAKKCFEEKRKRPEMVEVTAMFSELFKNL